MVGEQKGGDSRRVITQKGKKPRGREKLLPERNGGMYCASQEILEEKDGWGMLLRFGGWRLVNRRSKNYRIPCGIW